MRAPEERDYNLKDTSEVFEESDRDILSLNDACAKSQGARPPTMEETTLSTSSLELAGEINTPAKED